jgi:hypothetical protein
MDWHNENPEARANADTANGFGFNLSVCSLGPNDRSEGCHEIGAERLTLKSCSRLLVTVHGTASFEQIISKWLQISAHV